jgi:hypothetical protein
MSERPFLARVADDGTPSFTQSLDSAWSGRVDGFFETTDGWSALVATGSGLFTAVLGPRTDPTVDYQDERVWNLSDVLGRVAPGAGVLTYVGAAPACSDTPYFCEERRGLFTAASEHQGASTCGGGLWRDPGPVDEVEVEFEFPTVLRPGVVPADRLSQLLVQEVSPELVAVALEPQRLCQEAGSRDVAVLP